MRSKSKKHSKSTTKTSVSQPESSTKNQLLAEKALTKNLSNIKILRIALIRKMEFLLKIWWGIKKISLIRRRRILFYFQILRIRAMGKVNLKRVNNTRNQKKKLNKRRRAPVLPMENQLQKLSSMRLWVKQLK